MRFPLPVICSLLFLLISFHSSFASSTLRNALYKGSFLSVEDHSDLLTSTDQSFTCGFHSVGYNAYSFAIWFTNSANKTIVWMANRDQPVHSRRSRLSLHRDGNMVLTDFDGSTVWSTNTNTNSTSHTIMDKAELLSTGNLVLKNRRGKILWQSFDYPTDTLLPSQPITKNKKLISAKGKGTYSSGYFSLYFDNDNVLRLIYDGPEISSVYWPNPGIPSVFENKRTSYNSSRIAVLDKMGRFLSSDKLEFSASDMDFGIWRRLTIDYDGNLRLYSLNESSGLWVISWQALPRLCDVHGLCGRNGICHYTPIPKCSCPPGYNMSDPSDWNEGCKPKFNRSCGPTQDVKFVQLPHTDFFGFDLDFIAPLSFETCRNFCLGNCSCEAFAYRLTGKGTCYLKSELFNGFNAPSFRSSTYLKLPSSVEISGPSTPSDPTCRSKEDNAPPDSSATYNKERGRTKWVYLYSFVLAIGAIEAFFMATGWWFLFRKRGVPSLDNGYRAISSQFRRFTYAELKKATKNFGEELGKGGSGVVYKGVLGDGRVAAVKKLGDVIQGEDEFWSEVSTIRRIYHMNLVRMWGFCSEKVHRLLVYEYVVNGSLDKHLFSNACSSSINNSNNRASLLQWKERFKVALGTAKGLAYLHHECLEWVIHCDMKPENILLGDDFEAKISDFGLAKLSKRGGRGSEFSRIRGTKGYMAPEWALNLPITAKVDVYSYGIVLLEIVKGFRLSSFVAMEVDGEEEEPELWRFLTDVKMKIENVEDSWVEDIVDPRLNGQLNGNQAATMIKIGIACTEIDRSKRPTMDVVVQTLLECEDEPQLHNTDTLQVG